MRDSVTSLHLHCQTTEFSTMWSLPAARGQSVIARRHQTFGGRTVDLNGDAVIELWWRWRVCSLSVLVLRPAGVQIRAGEPAVVDQNLRALRDLDPRAWEALLEERRSEVFCAKL